MAEPPLPLTPEQRIKELEEQLALSNQKAQFFEAVVNVLKNDYGVSVVKSDPASPLPRSNPRPEHYQGLPIHGHFASSVLPT